MLKTSWLDKIYKKRENRRLREKLQELAKDYGVHISRRNSIPQMQEKIKARILEMPIPNPLYKCLDGEQGCPEGKIRCCLSCKGKAYCTERCDGFDDAGIIAPCPWKERETN